MIDSEIRLAQCMTRHCQICVGDNTSCQQPWRKHSTTAHELVNMHHLTLIELSTEPENSLPLEIARHTTLPSWRVRACMQRMCSMFHTCSTPKGGGGQEQLKKHTH